MLATQKGTHDRGILHGAQEPDIEGLIARRVGPGMLVVAPPMRLIHMNQTAWELIQQINDHDADGAQTNGHHPKRAKGLLPKSLRDFCTDIVHHLESRPHAKDWERFEIKRLICLADHPILLRGFGIPDSSGPELARVVLLLEEISPRREPFRSASVEKFQLTKREQAVVQCLAKGWTNKEIAGALKLALPTVKEHIRHIMEKTKTSTRTGILVEIFHK